MKSTLSQLAYDRLWQLLLSGAALPGKKLSPAKLAREFGMSHIPVREALRQLQSEGLIVHVPHCGSFPKQPERTEVAELIDLRTALECHAVIKAARRIGDAELDDLERLVQAMAELAKEVNAQEPRDLSIVMSCWGAIDMTFHRLLLHAAGNRELIKVIEAGMIRMFGFRADYPTSSPDLAALFEGNYQVHLDVFTAVRRHDPKAARRAMAAHMHRARKNLLDRFDFLIRQHQAPKPPEVLPDPTRRLIRDVEEHWFSGSSVFGFSGLSVFGREVAAEDTQQIVETR